MPPTEPGLCPAARRHPRAPKAGKKFGKRKGCRASPARIKAAPAVQQSEAEFSSDPLPSPACPDTASHSVLPVLR